MDNKELKFDKIYETFSPGLRSYLSRMAPSLDTDDLLQEVFEKINRELKNFKKQSSIKTWIYKIATHTAYDRFRSLSSKKYVYLKDTVPVETHGPDNGELCEKYVEPIDSQMIRKQMSSCVLDIVERLDDPYKSVLILKDLENFKNREIAHILQISLENVKMRLHRAREKLKKELELNCDFSHDKRNVFVCLPKQN
ncbi:MAG: RNA polymerase sigma factor [Proteobacteria bacterium]|nr:RNA polymerase sigma factor [Pseudomonadota bacterium]MBU1583238.1 RNA polymerase sigma factor [Pseudomonadota bacterium]MBU2630834.1 RNA polymerase sigma factor [Pseudomonadota bacterium]